MSDEDGDQQRPTAVVQVGRPDDLVPPAAFDVGDELKQGLSGGHVASLNQR
ncbi:hypothetical protein [Arthrobacter sp. ISL-95]|uniref:hypothetical protein n=1 Tax=Arthrobacter sp. ISL-95 TaxID=2819116 RepID=UPI001BE817EA|nr:hypothetical protein [Arthrobacter sp. ISL-95]